MKKLLSAACAAVLALTALFCGCGSPEYDFYTNIPEGAYAKKDEDFTVHAIGGYAEESKEYKNEDTSAYTSKSWTRYGIVDAQLIVSDDFSKDGAETKFSLLVTEINGLIDSIDKAVSTTVVNSDISKFNAAEAGAKIEIGKVAYEILSEAVAAYNFTDGYYNPALYYNVLAYGFASAHKYPQNSGELPDNKTIEKYTLLSHHFNEVKLQEADGKYYVEKPLYTVEIDGESITMKLDLAGISKGYAVDRIEELFDKYSYNYGMFSYGASSMLVRSNVREGNYRLGLINPRSPQRDTYIEIPLRNQKLSTSGDNEQRYFIDGVRYCHIIDPTTGKPVQTGIMSATVIGGGAAEADALTTAIMCMGKDKAIKFIEEKLTDRKVVFTFD